MGNKVKIVGYAKREFFNNGIEYRNFSPDLVGNQTTSEIGTSVFTVGNFNITTNLDSKVDKIFITNEYGDFTSLESLNLDESIKNLFFESSKKVKLNLDSNDVLNYAYFGSLREYIRVSLENIIISWPASIYVRPFDELDVTFSGSTVLNYDYDTITNKATFEVSTDRLSNPFDINFITDGTIVDTFNETNDLRNLSVNYSNYIISSEVGDFPILDFVGASATTNATMYITVEGNAFPQISTYDLFYHIKPNTTKQEEFFIGLNEFENNLLNRYIIPIYTASFKVTTETEKGASVDLTRTITWPISDGYNLDFNSKDYVSYVNTLLSLAAESDDLKSDLMVRFLVSKSISEFDTIPDIDGTFEGSNGQKMNSTLKIYGREFDELKRYMDGISFANVVTYDKKNNTPDLILKNLARIMGWDLTSSIEELDLIGNYLTPKDSTYEGLSRGLTNTEAEIELWRRIILNTPWIWKSKGTRKTIEFLFKFIGTPDGLITFNEYIYVADKALDAEVVTDMMEQFNDTRDISSLNIDSDGFPKTLPNTPDMYFQKAGLWYRTTGGANPEIDILYGNNPHIGPYDGGQAYIDQFTNCLIPNFVEVDETNEIINSGTDNLFTNFDNGTFNECCDSDILVTLDTDKDFDALLASNINKFIQNEPVTETGCTIVDTWTIVASLTGNTFYTSTPIITSGTTGLIETQYVAELDIISAEPELSGTTGTYYSGTSEYKIVSADEDCDNELLGTYFKVEVQVSSTFDCLDEGITGLTGFPISQETDDGCNPSSALSLIDTFYHDGVGILPVSGDTVYTDSLGVSPYISVEGADRYMGHNFADSSNWLTTDGSGVRIPLDCPEALCNITTGISDFDNITKMYHIDGITSTTGIQIRFYLSDYDPQDPLIQVVTDKFGVLSGLVPERILDFVISPNGGTTFDYEVLIQNTETSLYRINIEILKFHNECVDIEHIKRSFLSTD